MSSSIDKNLLIIIVGRIIQIIVSILAIRITTELLSPFEYGRLGILTGIFLFIGLFFLTPIGSYVNRQIIHWNQKSTIKLYFYYYFSYIIFIALISSAIASIIYSSIGLGITITIIWLITIIILYTIFNTINQTIIPSLNLLGYRLEFVILTITTSITGLLLSILFVKLFGNSMEFWISGQIVGFALLALLGWFIFTQKTNRADKQPLELSKIKFSTILPILKFAIPLSVVAGLFWCQYQSYRFFLVNDGLNFLGIFIAGYGISAAVMAAYEGLITNYYLPIFYKNVTNATLEQQSVAWYKYAMLLFPTLIVTILFTIATAPYLTKILLAKSYQEAAYVFVIWGAIIEGLRVLAGCISIASQAIFNSRILIIPNLLGASAVLLGIPFLGTYFSLGIATALTLTIAGTIFVISLYLLVNKVILLKIDILTIAKALFISIPVLALLLIPSSIINTINMIAILLITGCYYLFIQFIIFKQWSKKYQ